jgi:hypothetical protein
MSRYEDASSQGSALIDDEIEVHEQTEVLDDPEQLVDAEREPSSDNKAVRKSLADRMRVPVAYDDLFEEGEIHEGKPQNWSISFYCFLTRVASSISAQKWTAHNGNHHYIVATSYQNVICSDVWQISIIAWIIENLQWCTFFLSFLNHAGVECIRKTMGLLAVRVKKSNAKPEILQAKEIK